MKAHEIFKQRGYYWVKIKPSQTVFDDAQKIIDSEETKQHKLGQQIIETVQNKILNAGETTTIVEYDGGFCTHIFFTGRKTSFHDFNRVFEVVSYELLPVEYTPFGENNDI